MKRSVSVTGVFYERIKAEADRRGLSISSIVEHVISRELPAPVDDRWLRKRPPPVV